MEEILLSKIFLGIFFNKPVLRSCIEGSGLSAVFNFVFWPRREAEREFVLRIAHWTG